MSDVSITDNSNLSSVRRVSFGDFIKYVSLNVIGLLAFNCYILADTFFVSLGVGLDGLTALNLALPVFGLVHGFGMMFGMGGATKRAVARANGGDVDKPFTHSLTLAVVAGAAFVLLGAFGSGALARFFGASGEVLPLTEIYLRVCLYFAPAFLINHVVMCYVRNDGSPLLAMIALSAGSLSNVLLDWVFIFPLHMGMFGAILATGLAPVISLCVLVFHFFTKKNTVKLRFTKPDFKTFGGIVYLGVFSFVSEISNGVSILVFNTVILALTGDIGVAAYGIAANVFLVAIGFFNGVAQGVQPLISRSVGDGAQIKRLYIGGIITAAALGAVLFALLAGFAGPIVSVFNSGGNAQLADIAVKGFPIYFSALVFAGFNVVSAGLFGAVGKGGRAFVITLLRGILVIIPVLLLLAYLLDMTGVWISFPVTEITVAAVSAAFIAIFFKKNRKLSL